MEKFNVATLTHIFLVFFFTRIYVFALAQKICWKPVGICVYIKHISSVLLMDKQQAESDSIIGILVGKRILPLHLWSQH